MSELLRYIKVYRTCLKNSLVREMEFRLNFYIWGLAMLMEYSVVLLFFNGIYAAVDSIGGWTKYEYYFYLGFMQILLTAFMIFIFPNVCSLPYKINSGEMDFILLKPISSQFMVSLKNINYGYIVNIFAGFALIAYGLADAAVNISLVTIIAALVYSVIGTAILYSIFFVLSTVAIWTKRAGFASDIFFNLWEFMRLPGSVYGYLSRVIFTYIFPILLICSVPVDVFLNRSDAETMITAAIIAVIWFAASILFWNRSIKSYTSASS